MALSKPSAFGYLDPYKNAVGSLRGEVQGPLGYFGPWRRWTPGLDSPYLVARGNKWLLSCSHSRIMRRLSRLCQCVTGL